MAKIDGVQEVRLADLTPYERNAKKHSAEQVQKIADSINEFGFLSPILIDRAGNIIAGHGRVLAAKSLGMEPVELFKKLIRNSSRPGDLVLDLFAGSGTSIIAAEEMDRRCFAMEFDPVYADVIIRRWEEATGQIAKPAEA